MKVSHIVFTLLFACASTVAIPPTYARPDEVDRATIPFDFYVGDQKLPAGTYTLELDLQSDRVLLRDASCRHAIYLTGIPTDRTMDKPELLFVHSGDSYVFRELKGEFEGITFHSEMLGKILANGMTATRVEVALNK